MGGFDPENLPGIIHLAQRHRNLYVDTSLYGSNCELWFTRGSNQAGPLASFVNEFPKQVLFWHGYLRESAEAAKGIQRSDGCINLISRERDAGLRGVQGDGVYCQDEGG